MEIAISNSQAVDAGERIDADLSWSCENLTQDICATLKQEWENLASAATEPNPFQSPDYVAHSLPLLGDWSPQLIQIREAGLLIGLVTLRRDWGYAKLPLLFWRTALHHEQFLGTPLVREGCEEAFTDGLFKWLDQAPRDCFFINLTVMSSDGAVAKALAVRCGQTGRVSFATNHYQRAAIRPRARSGASAEDMLRPSRRKNLRKTRKKLEALGQMEFQRLNDKGELDAWIEHFLAMEDTGWKHEEGSSILSCPHETQLYRVLIRGAFDAGGLHFNRLCLDGKPIAYTLDVTAGPLGYCLKSAIDQDYRKYSPGVLMEQETLKHYLGKGELALVDSCSAPDNAMLNEMWPDKVAVCDLIIGRKGAGYQLACKLIHAIKKRMNASAKT